MIFSLLKNPESRTPVFTSEPEIEMEAPRTWKSEKKGIALMKRQLAMNLSE